MYEYYSDRLSASRLMQVYELAPPRIRQYLAAEVAHVLDRARGCRMALELGCGYGRVLEQIADHFEAIAGVDTAIASLDAARTLLQNKQNCFLAQMDACSLGFRDQSFDCVICIQNGISAFHADPLILLRESLRVSRRGGVVLYSTYAEEFWKQRLHWFELQSQAGLLGPIDYAQTGDGTIVCSDGFTATTALPAHFAEWSRLLGVTGSITVVDNSSLFFEIRT